MQLEKNSASTLTKSFNQLISFLLANNTYDIGSTLCLLLTAVMNQLCNSLLEAPKFEIYSQMFFNIQRTARQVTFNLEQNAFLRGLKVELGAIVVINSLLFNLYRFHSKQQKKRISSEAFNHYKSANEADGLPSQNSSSFTDNCFSDENLDKFRLMMLNLINQREFLLDLLSLVQMVSLSAVSPAVPAVAGAEDPALPADRLDQIHQREGTAEPRAFHTKSG